MPAPTPARAGPAHPPSPTERARYFNSGNAFALKLPRVPCHRFTAERDRAFDDDAPSGFVDMDLGESLGLDFPATTPLVMSRYLRLRAGEAAETRLHASVEIYAVLAGSGETTSGNERIDWNVGDVFCLPGGQLATHLAGHRHAVLWVVTNEPLLAFDALSPPGAGTSPIVPVHYPRDTLRAELDALYALPDVDTFPGYAVVLSSERLEASRNISPTLTLALNSLPSGKSQRPHRHNAAALTLCLRGEGCYSVIEGERVEWEPNVVMVTPPDELHSHHNEGPERMESLVVQDGGLHYHCRTMGFEYAGATR